MSEERLYSLKRGTLSRLAAELDERGLISAERVAAILNESATAPAPATSLAEDDETGIDPVTAEVLEAEDRARLAREEQEGREAEAAWPAFCATMQIDEAA